MERAARGLLDQGTRAPRGTERRTAQASDYDRRSVKFTAVS